MKLDPKLAFYLKHRQQIEEWLNCKKRLPAEACRFFASLAGDLDTFADSCPSASLLWSALDDSWAKLMLYQPAWYDNVAACPLVGVGLEWPQKSANFETLCLGIKILADPNEYGDLSTALAALKYDVGGSALYASNRTWPVWRYVKPTRSDYWEDLDGFRDEILRTTKEFWADVHETVDAAVRSHTNTQQ